MSIARPAAAILRRPLQSDLKKHVLIAAGLSAAVAVIWKLTVSDVRKKHYAEFYKNYDEERHFKRMAAAGVFQSVKPDTPAPQWLTDYEREVDKAIAALKK